VFAVPNAGGRADSRAVLVIRHGRLLSERYAPGFSATTPFLGWSATKSLTSGILVSDGKLDLDKPAPVPEWRGAGDPRGAITLRQLLTMSSGLKFIEDYVAGSDSSQMLFHERDMAAYAARQPLQHPPGTVWSYSSGTANIVSRIVKQAVGGRTEDYQRFAHDRLFGPLGMDSALVEPDESGTPVGSSYGYATARDWARFGLLYLNRGMAGDRRILPENWVDFTRAPTPAAPSPVYGAMFWLNQDPGHGPGPRAYPHCPPDMYLAEGHNGQFVAIIPSLDAVIVRLGWTSEGPEFNVDRYFSPITAALAAG
jgi:CubicO group peptidase (beta-lactamase class C family)